MTASELTNQIDRLIRARIAEVDLLKDGSTDSVPFAQEAREARAEIEEGLKQCLGRQE